MYTCTAIENMLDNISAHPKWPYYADVFEHPLPFLTSRCPVCALFVCPRINLKA